MRRLFGVLSFACAAFPASGWAFDWTPDTTRYLSDPSFLPMQGQVESITSYSYETSNADWRHVSRGKTEQYFSIHDFYVENLGYGITDRLRIGVSEDFYESKTKYTFYGRYPENESSDHGFGNPVFGVTYRILEQGYFPVSIDSSVFYSPNFAENSSQVESGEILLSNEMKSLTIQGNVGFDHSDSFNGKDTSISSSWKYYTGVVSQLRLSSRWAVNAGISVSQETSNFVVSSGGSYTNKYDPSVATHVALQYHIIPNVAVVGLEYAHRFGGDDNRSGYFNGTWTNNSADTYTAHLRLLF